MLEFKKYELPPIGTNAYLAVDSETNECVLFDAPLNAWATLEPLIVKLGYNLKAVCFTHGHWDHILNGHIFAEKKIPCYAQADDRQFYDDPSSMASFAIPGLEMKAVQVSNWVDGGQVIKLLGRSVEIRHIPGHSPGSILFWFEGDGVAITGDAIFNGSIGRTDFPGCSFEVLEKSIQESIYSLPPETRILPGHGPETTVEFEMENNPFVRAK